MPSSHIGIILVAIPKHHCLLTGVHVYFAITGMRPQKINRCWTSTTAETYINKISIIAHAL